MAASKSHRTAFTLVELLTVITIIGILVAILLPALNEARKSALRAASKAGLNTIGQGLEIFRTDSANNGQYPPSHAPYRPALQPAQYTGANWLADALVGHDLLGWDPLALSQPDGAWQDCRGTNRRGNVGVTSRKGPYVEVDSIKHLPDAVAGSEVKSALWPCMMIQNSRVLVDKSFGDTELTDNSDSRVLNGVILYYRANPAAQSTWGLAGNGPVQQQGQFIYDWSDNQQMIQRVDARANPGRRSELLDAESFYSHIEDKEIREQIERNQAAIRRPYHAETYLLISPGFDGLYGTVDDVTNFSF